MNRSSPPSPLLIVAALAALAVTGGCAVAQPAADPATDSGLTCEVYCSETELRTAIARISWTGPGASGPAAAEILQTTVYKGGFDRDLYASFPLGGGAAPEAPSLPAYDLEILEIGRPAAASGGPAPEADSEARTSVEIGGLEAGIKYIWRVVVETAAGRQISETVTCEAPVCTADYQPGGPNSGI